jgi:uncharacterized membrane protein YfcA
MSTMFFETAGLGILIGIIMGITGAGGGILSLPILIFALHLPIAQASPIALSAITLAATAGALIGFQGKVLRYKAAFLMSLIGLLLSPIGLWLAQSVPNTPLQVLFGIILLYVSIKMLTQAHQEQLGVATQRNRPPPCQIDPLTGKFDWNISCAKCLMFAGAIAGFLSGLLGVGGGFVIVPSLKRFTDLPMKSIVATSLGVLAIVSAGGATLSLLSGTLNTEIAIPFALGSLIGLLIGKVLEKKISGPRAQQMFAALALLVGISLIAKTF